MRQSKRSQLVLLVAALFSSVAATISLACTYMADGMWDLPDFFTETDGGGMAIISWIVFPAGLLLAVICLSTVRRIQRKQYDLKITRLESLVCLLATPVVLGIAIGIGSVLDHKPQDNTLSESAGIAMLLMASLQFLLIVRNIVQVWRHREEK